MNVNTQMALRQRLLTLPFDAFASLVARLLPALGYENVRLAGRHNYRGRNGRDGAGGFDLLATKGGRKVLVQLKQFEEVRSLYQRSIDELRGVALRSGAAEALLLTTGGFSPTVDREALRRSPIASVVTIDGDELVELLHRHRVGVTKDGSIDEALLEQLVLEARGNGPSDSAGGPSFVVIVGVRRVAKRKPARLLPR